MSRLKGEARLETWTYRTPLVISRGTIHGAALLVVELHDGTHRGRGEACPLAFFGEDAEAACARARAVIADLETPDDWSDLHDATSAGAARNAIDCAVWDLRAKIAGRRVTDLIGAPRLGPVPTAYTLGLDAPAAMAEAARSAASEWSLLKIKLGDWPQDLDRVRAVRAAAPAARLMADVNEAWDRVKLEAALPPLKALGVELVEQPLPRGDDADLAGLERLVPIGADESCHTAADLPAVAGLYDAINIKLDKAGGLTEGLRLAAGARARGLGVMVGCMVATSLGIAPSLVVAPHCRWVDLDSPLMLAGDREPPLEYVDGMVRAPAAALWG